MNSTVTLPCWECLRCGHKWIPKKSKRPKICPKCRSAWWDEVREEKAK